MLNFASSLPVILRPLGFATKVRGRGLGGFKYTHKTLIAHLHYKYSNNLLVIHYIYPISI